MRVAGRALDLGFAALAAAQLGAAALVVSRDGEVALPGGSVGGMCPSRALFGVECPLCGMTRSFAALAHGRVGESFEFHPAGPLLAAAMIAFVAAAVVVAVRRAVPLVERRRVLMALMPMRAYSGMR
jgi:hypothetical protein